MRRMGLAALAAWWVVALVVATVTSPFTNDHLGRLTAARQIARYGEVPFRDFLEPGYVLTEFASAGVQLLFGDSLLGELLWTSAALATGAVLVIVLTQRQAPSRMSAVVMAMLVILAEPRRYDFDKFLFYPLGILLCWRYTALPTAGRLWTLAGCAVVAGLFRYDNGLFVLLTGLVTIATLHRSDVRTRRHRAVLFLAASATCAVPYVLFLQMNGGVVNAVSQMLTYARREGTRTRLTELPVPSGLHFARQPDLIQIRWDPSVDAERPQLEARYSLRNGVPRAEPHAGIWSYAIDDVSHGNLRALINDPHVADTNLIDRATATIVREGTWASRLYRRLPFIGRWTVSWEPEDAAKALYWVFLFVPVAVIVALWRHGAADDSERAPVIGAVAMAVLVIGFILREPIIARISGASAPTFVLAAWLWRRVHRNWTGRIVAVAVIMTAAVATSWPTTARWVWQYVPKLPDTLPQAATTPPPLSFLPASEVSGVVGYVRRCTEPDDRVFVGWYAPEVYFFGQRAFAGGVFALFGHHWSESAHQRRIIAKMKSESVPVVILPNENRDFQETYTEISQLFQTEYRSAGATTFGQPGPSYILLTRADRTPTRTDPASSMPCFAAG